MVPAIVYHSGGMEQHLPHAKTLNYYLRTNLTILKREGIKPGMDWNRTGTELKAVDTLQELGY